MKVNGLELDIKFQINEVNTEPTFDESRRELRRQYYVDENLETDNNRYDGTKNLLVENFCKVLDKNLPHVIYTKEVPFSYIMTFFINGFPFIFEKYDSRFKLMGKIMTKKEALTAIVKTAMYGGTSKKEGGDVFLFFSKYIDTPNIIKRAIEERIVYRFPQYEVTPVFQNVLINVQKVGKKRYALEISDNVWGGISEKDLIAFIKIHSHKKKNVRSKWWKIKPEKLWEYTIGEAPTKSQLNTMIQFLLHNRKDKIVVDKSIELVKSLTKFKDIKISRRGPQLQVLVRGKEAYWYIHGEIKDTVHGGLQDVATTLITKCLSNDIPWYSRFSGPDVCIDNLMGGSSIGDQIYSRAMVCMNDNISKNTVSTIQNKLRNYDDEIMTIDYFDEIENIWEEE